MSQSFVIALLTAVCACSTNAPEPTGAGDPPAPPAATPDPQALPASERLHPEPVDSVADVPGSYVQPLALPGDVSLITLATPSWGQGSYQLYRSCGLPTCIPELGQYDIIATNPAIGFAALSLLDQTGTIRATYILDQLWRDSHGALVAIQLRPVLANATGPTQMWWRLPSTTAAPTQTAPAPAPIELTAPSAPSTTDPSLGGVFVRALPIYGDIDALTLDDAAWSHDHATGTYEAAYPYCLPWCLGESGDYALDLANPATGTGQLSLVPAGNAPAARDYAVYAIWRAPDNTAAAIQLQRIDGVIPTGPLFTLYRQWWTTALAARAPDATCTTLASLAAYYRGQALLCGTSACWSLAPWYSAWAQYYDGLARADGCYAS